MTTTPRHRHRTLAVGLALCAGLAATLAACGSKGGSTVAPLGGSASPAAGASTTFATVATSTAPASSTTAAAPAGTGSAGAGSPTTAGAASPGTSVVPGVTNRSIVYRQFTVTVQRAVTSRLDPDAFAAPAGSADATPGDDTYAYVEVRVKNDLSFASNFIAHDEVRLAPASGDPIKMADGVGKAIDIVDEGATNAGWFAYRVPAGLDLTGAALLFGHAGEEIERLPLTGTVPPPAWPKTLTLSSPGTVTFYDSAKPFTVDVKIDKAQLATSLAYDDGRTSFASKQSLAGRRKLLVEFTANLVTTSSPGDAGEVLSYEAARLVIDGERQSGVAEVSDSESLTIGTPYHGRYVFDVPAKGKVQLAWGDVKNPVLVDVPVS